MSAYKKLNSQDVYITDYQAQKSWVASGSTVSEYDIETLRGLKEGLLTTNYPYDLKNGRSQHLTYRSLIHNYYSGSLPGGIFTGSRDLSLQTTLTYSGSRNPGVELAAISIPRNVFGTHIVPSSIVALPAANDTDSYIEDDYAVDIVNGNNDYFPTPYNLLSSTFGGVDSEDYLEDESNYVTESITGSPGQYMDVTQNQQRPEIIDDGDGNLFFSGSELSFTRPKRFLGDVIYNQGMIIFTDRNVASTFGTYLTPNLQWKSNQPIYTYNVHCKVKDSEMGFTFNPSAITGSNGVIANNVTGSEFNPYFTSVGLYNDANELIAVAKTNRAIPKPKNTDLTVVVKIDI